MSQLSVNDITRVIKSSNHSFPTINTNSFLQLTSIPINLVSNVDKTPSETNIKSKSHLTFISNEILEMPEYFSNFIDLNKFYIFGCKHILESLIYLLDTNYKLENTSNKKANLEEFYLFILGKLHVCFHENKEFYMEKKMKKVAIEKLIKQTFQKDSELDNHVKFDICYVICNIYKVNILVLNIEKKLYTYYNKSYDNNIILLEYDKKILPLIEIYGNFLSNDIITEILTHFKPKLSLNKISQYSLINLQELCQQNNIDIIIDNKKKIKQQLYDDLLLLS
jgi:hypothetical protein